MNCRNRRSRPRPSPSPAHRRRPAARRSSSSCWACWCWCWRPAPGPTSTSSTACPATTLRWMRHITAIAPKIPGNVLEVLVQDNQPVKAGDVLVRIDPRDYQARVDIARAALLQAREPVAYRADGSAPDQRHHPIRRLGRGRPAGRCHGRSWIAPAWRTSRPPARISPSSRPMCGPSRPATNAPRPISRA